MHELQRSIGREKAIELSETNWWEALSDREIVGVQLFITELCMPFSRFHEAVEKALGRSVWTHEFASSGHLVEEFLGQREAPTMEEIFDLLPKGKRILVVAESD